MEEGWENLPPNIEKLFLQLNNGINTLAGMALLARDFKTMENTRSDIEDTLDKLRLAHGDKNDSH